MNKNNYNRRRPRNENILKLRFPSGGSPEGRKTSQIRIAKELEKIARNRSCYVHPKQNDFSQITELPFYQQSDAYNTVPSVVWHLPKPIEQNSINAFISSKKNLLEDFGTILRKNSRDTQKIGASSTLWNNIDSIEDIEHFLHETREDPTHLVHSLPQNVHISEAPKIKTIAEKFSKFKRNNMELRRLDEKVVCLEYDIFDQDDESSKPIQRMRAFFSIKPDYKESNEEPFKELPIQVKEEFKLLDEDVVNLTEKEIEIIDDNINANKTYLEDLKRILKQKQLIDTNKNKNALDLKSLYEMARRASFCMNSDLAINFLSAAELEEIKGLILSECKSSMHGISRRKINKRDESNLKGCVSGSIIAELLRENGKIDVFK